MSLIDAPPSSGWGNAFISYRWSDFGGHAPDVVYRLYESLCLHYENVFFDREELPPGVDFPDYLAESVKNSDLLFVVIGPQWESLLVEANKSPDKVDHVRAEIETAIDHSVPTIPLLMGGANEPNKSTLTGKLEGLSKALATKIGSGQEMGDDVKRMAKSIEKEYRPGEQPDSKLDNYRFNPRVNWTLNFSSVYEELRGKFLSIETSEGTIQELGQVVVYANNTRFNIPNFKVKRFEPSLKSFPVNKEEWEEFAQYSEYLDLTQESWRYELSCIERQEKEDRPKDGRRNCRLKRFRCFNGFFGFTKPTVELTYQVVSYFYFLRTNMLIDEAWGDTRSVREALIEKYGKTLEPLEESPLGNNLGINYLIFSSDGILILPRRSKKATFRQNKLTPSSSGTVEIDDFEQLSVQKIPPFWRETQFELGIERAKRENVEFLGLTRELPRGGEPEMFFSAKVGESGVEVRKAMVYAEESAEHEDQGTVLFQFGDLAFIELDDKGLREQFKATFWKLCAEVWEDSCLPLKTALALWYHRRLGNEIECHR